MTTKGQHAGAATPKKHPIRAALGGTLSAARRAYDFLESHGLPVYDGMVLGLRKVIYAAYEAGFADSSAPALLEERDRLKEINAELVGAIKALIESASVYCADPATFGADPKKLVADVVEARAALARAEGKG